MRLRNVRAGDIVRVSDGSGSWLAVATGDPKARRLPVQMIGGAKIRRAVTARVVTGHWERTDHTPLPPEVG